MLPIPAGKTPSICEVRELSGEIETKRLMLRRWSEHDAQALYQLCLDPELRRSGIHWYESEEESGRILRHWKDNPEARAIVRREDQQLIGMISLEDMNRYPQYKELEYAIAAQERGNGYAVEAVEAMLRYAFLQRDISVVAAWVRAFNQPSVRVLQRCALPTREPCADTRGTRGILCATPF